MSPPPSRIAFGSCNDQELQNDLWPNIARRKPSAFIWAGDAIYADVQLPTDWSTFPPKSELVCATPQRLRHLYRRQLSIPGYQMLLTQNISVFGTFDDHDYGCNNADRTYPHKYESGQAFVDFLGQSENSPMGRRANAGLGVYGVKLFDFSKPDGQHMVPDAMAQIDPDMDVPRFPNSAPINLSNQTVAVFVLDVRTHKTPWKEGSEAFRPDYAGDFLGERQWKWFETAIHRSRAAVNVIVTGLQVHADRFPDGNVAEAWGKYPMAQQRLFDALLQDGVQAPILVSGDVHMTQLMRKDCMRASDLSMLRMRTLVEMTTSGMTHSWATLANPPRYNPEQKHTFIQRYKTLLAGSLMRLLHWTCPWTDLMVSQPSLSDTTEPVSLFENGGGEGSTSGLQFSLLKNFGELEFDWETRTVTMRTMGKDPEAPPLLMARMSMDKLSGSNVMPGGKLSMADFRREQGVRNSMVQGEWVCINHRGHVNFVEHIWGHIMVGVVLTTLVPFPFLLPTYALLILIRQWMRKPVASQQPSFSKVKKVA